MPEASLRAPIRSGDALIPASKGLPPLEEMRMGDRNRAGLRLKKKRRLGSLTAYLLSSSLIEYEKPRLTPLKRKRFSTY
jgi:hypothetical protein